uniref:Uncharacterized protein n=1 Tax=Knipowitschia caucasica TaxID=637954 RepID=A0AAV2KY15_KNICA
MSLHSLSPLLVKCEDCSSIWAPHLHHAPAGGLAKSSHLTSSEGQRRRATEEKELCGEKGCGRDRSEGDVMTGEMVKEIHRKHGSFVGGVAVATRMAVCIGLAHGHKF